MPREKKEKRAFQVKGIGFIKAGRHKQHYYMVIKKKKKPAEMDGV